jgi:tRNA nucleotidyltransferase (CCA-adding enzyme)
MHIILTHHNADFDAVASMFGAWKLKPGATPVLPVRQNANVVEFLALYRSGLPFVNWQDFKARHIAHITLTDTQTVPQVRNAKPDTPLHIIEHHAPERDPAPHETLDYYPLGAITTYFVEQIQAQHIALTPLEATLLALGIYEDTGMLTYGGTTARDVRAIAWLLDNGAMLDTIRRFLEHPLNDEQQALFKTLLEHTETLLIQGYAIIIASTQLDFNLHGINSVAASLREILDCTALIVLVQMPEVVQLVARSADDAVNVGAVAQHFGGGGHVRAAAAAIHGKPLSDIRETIRAMLVEQIQPAVRVGDLMSYRPRTVRADEIVKDIVPLLRRIGHEGYPVLDANQQVVGLLTRRDADRAVEHGLSSATVRDIMQSGSHTLMPDASVPILEELMVSSGWGQIPIVDAAGTLTGIVTRTDLIKHHARTQKTIVPPQPTVSRLQMAEVLGEATAALIEIVAQHAQQQHITLHLIGGTVRDILLNRYNQDIDFVVEGDGIAFARQLQDRYGGKLHTHAPFGTAKWHLDDAVRQALALKSSPEHLDFVTARNEFYAHPTALPTVYSGSIKLDVARRDFTLNTLAVQVSPAGAFGRILDVFGGVADLEAGIIRVLHSLSFVDDPTRMLRAVRFAERLNFTLEPRTAELMQSALPMLRRITGERLRNELTLLLQEVTPERALRQLDKLGILSAIHPALHFDDNVMNEVFRKIKPHPPTPGQPSQGAAPKNGDAEILPKNSEIFYFAAWFAQLDDVTGICERLLFGATETRLLVSVATLHQEQARLQDKTAKISDVVRWLETFPPEALALVAFLLDETAQGRLVFYREKMLLRPLTDGNRLIALGLKPGKHFKTILDTLRDAWLDGDIQNASDEDALLQRLMRHIPE